MLGFIGRNRGAECGSRLVKESEELDGACRSSSNSAVTVTSPKLLPLASLMQLNYSAFPVCGAVRAMLGTSSLHMT